MFHILKLSTFQPSLFNEVTAVAVGLGFRFCFGHFSLRFRFCPGLLLHFHCLSGLVDSSQDFGCSQDWYTIVAVSLNQGDPQTNGNHSTGLGVNDRMAKSWGLKIHKIIQKLPTTWIGKPFLYDPICLLTQLQTLDYAKLKNGNFWQFLKLFQLPRQLGAFDLSSFFFGLASAWWNDGTW